MCPTPVEGPCVLFCSLPDQTVIHAHPKLKSSSSFTSNAHECIEHCIHPEDVTQFLATWSQCHKETDKGTAECRFRFPKENEWQWYRITVEPIHVSDQVHFMVLGQSQTRERRALYLNEMKNQFVANMSHEIRTPLGIIMGFSDLLLDPETPYEDYHNFVEHIHKNAIHLSTLIEEILDLSRIEAGEVKVELTAFSLSNLMDELQSLLQWQAQSKNLALTFTSDPHLPDAILSDPTRIRQILLNVIGNAIKFTERGGVTINTRASYSQAHSMWTLHFEITDTGPGMTESQQRLLFQPFSRVAPDLRKKCGGTGLGLALSQKLAQALEGDIQVMYSEPGKGSTFSVSLMVEPAPPQKPQDLPCNDDASQMKKNRPRLL